MQTPRKSGKHENEGPAVRYSAVLPDTERSKSIALVSELALDRLPDRNGRIHVLISADEANCLLEQGIAVKLLAVIPIAPLEKSLVMTDVQAQHSLERRVKGIPRKDGG